MSLSLWMVLGFAAWTLLVLVAGVGLRRWALILRGEAALTSFPGDTPHGSSAYRRAMRAHANCLENLPIFAAIVLVAAVAGLSPPGLPALAVTTLVARVAQTTVHMLFAECGATVAIRFGFFLVQVIAMALMGVLLALEATHGPGAS